MFFLKMLSCNDIQLWSGLEVKARKNNWAEGLMFMSRHYNWGQNQNMKVTGKLSRRAAELKFEFYNSNESNN
jgi:hypothetical protein